MSSFDFTEDEMTDYQSAIDQLKLMLSRDFDMQSDNLEEALACLVAIQVLENQVATIAKETQDI